jgi:hypothetical protein
MAITPKQILDTAVGVGKAAVSAAERRLRGGERETTSGPPSTVGAAKPGEPGGPKSPTASMTSPSKPAKRKPAAKKKAKPKAQKDKTSTPRTRATGRRTTASRAAASSGPEVADAASGKDD